MMPRRLEELCYLWNIWKLVSLHCLLFKIDHATSTILLKCILPHQLRENASVTYVFIDCYLGSSTEITVVVHHGYQRIGRFM